MGHGSPDSQRGKNGMLRRREGNKLHHFVFLSLNSLWKLAETKKVSLLK